MEEYKLISPKNYEIDTEKVKTLEDVLSILSCFNIYVSLLDSEPKFEKLKPFLKEV